MTSRPILNYDILLEVAAASSWDDCAGLLNSCRFLHLEGPKALLRQDVPLASEKTLLQFLAFLHQTLGDVRIQSVRSLCFLFPALSKATSEKLAVALPCMLNLACLFLMNSERLFDGRPALLSAFAALSSLRKVALQGAGKHTIKMLVSSQSKLVALGISFPLGTGMDGFFDLRPLADWPKYHPAVILAQSCSTLQDLHCERWYTHPVIMPDPVSVYPEMRRLAMVEAMVPQTVALVRAYPKLTYLSIHTGEGDNLRPEKEFWGDQRDRNLLEQASHGSSWSKLDEYKGSLVDLYLLGLSCPITRMTLLALHQSHLYMLEPVLSDARPRFLISQGWPGELSSPADVFAAIRGPGGSRLESLGLRCRLEQKDDGVDVAAIMENLMSSLEHAPLHNLVFSIDIVLAKLRPRTTQNAARTATPTQQTGLPAAPPPSPDTIPLTAVERSAADFDMAEYAREFVRRFPALEALVGRITGVGGRWKQVTVKDGEVRFEEGGGDAPAPVV